MRVEERGRNNKRRKRIEGDVCAATERSRTYALKHPGQDNERRFHKGDLSNEKLLEFIKNNKFSSFDDLKAELSELKVKDLKIIIFTMFELKKPRGAKLYKKSELVNIIINLNLIERVTVIAGDYDVDNLNLNKIIDEKYTKENSHSEIEIDVLQILIHKEDQLILFLF